MAGSTSWSATPHGSARSHRCGHITPQEWGEILDLDLTANWRLIRAMDPLLRMAPAGRAIFVTSRLARDAPPYYGVYAVAKAGLETMVRIYAGEVARTAVRVNLIDPGVVRTRLRAAIFPGEDSAGLPMPESVTEAFVELAAAGMHPQRRHRRDRDGRNHPVARTEKHAAGVTASAENSRSGRLSNPKQSPAARLGLLFVSGARLFAPGRSPRARASRTGPIVSVTPCARTEPAIGAVTRVKLVASASRKTKAA